MGKAVKPPIEDGTGEVEGVKRTELWDWQECINPLQPIPRPFGRVGNGDDTCGTCARRRSRSAPEDLWYLFPVVDSVVCLRICGTFTRRRYGTTPAVFSVLAPYDSSLSSNFRLASLSYVFTMRILSSTSSRKKSL